MTITTKMTKQKRSGNRILEKENKLCSHLFSLCVCWGGGGCHQTSQFTDLVDCTRHCSAMHVCVVCMCVCVLLLQVTSQLTQGAVVRPLKYLGLNCLATGYHQTKQDHDLTFRSLQVS